MLREAEVALAGGMTFGYKGYRVIFPKMKAQEDAAEGSKCLRRP